MALEALINSWALLGRTNQHAIGRALNRQDVQESESIRGIATILRFTSVHDDTIEKVWSKAETMDDLRDSDVYAFDVYSELARLRPERRAELIDRLRRAVISDQDTKAQTAVRSLYNWLDTQESSSAEEPEGLDYLISEVGFVIAVRRSVVLRQALDIACWIFQKGYSRLCESIAKDCVLIPDEIAHRNEMMSPVITE